MLLPGFIKQPPLLASTLLCLMGLRSERLGRAMKKKKSALRKVVLPSRTFCILCTDATHTRGCIHPSVTCARGCAAHSTVLFSPPYVTNTLVDVFLDGFKILIFFLYNSLIYKINENYQNEG